MASKKSNNSQETIGSKKQRAQERRAKKIKKQILTVVIVILSIALVIGGLIGLGFVLDWWAYQPTSTYHASIELEEYGSLHVELYGNDAPETVAAFIDLVESGHYNGKSLDTLVDGKMISCGAEADIELKGEFESNGVENRVTHAAGALSMTLADENDPDSANGAFVILTETTEELDGERAAFGRVTNSGDVLQRIARDISEKGANPIIKSVSVHHAH